ncbi:hypothetical protein HNR39_000649 [Glaciimonas immobilis]|uniref:Uncharacterized protein n=1 Tax=Glaciimonas immobilis TaxID=728004 RepID=A0A840RQS5_9BURK|nr:hypothetical protein [Glaciimonas immobilis]
MKSKLMAEIKRPALGNNLTVLSKNLPTGTVPSCSEPMVSNVLFAPYSAPAVESPYDTLPATRYSAPKEESPYDTLSQYNRTLTDGPDVTRRASHLDPINRPRPRIPDDVSRDKFEIYKEEEVSSRGKSYEPLHTNQMSPQAKNSYSLEDYFEKNRVYSDEPYCTESLYTEPRSGTFNSRAFDRGSDSFSEMACHRDAPNSISATTENSHQTGTASKLKSVAIDNDKPSKGSAVSSIGHFFSRQIRGIWDVMTSFRRYLPFIS